MPLDWSATRPNQISVTAMMLGIPLPSLQALVLFSQFKVRSSPFLLPCAVWHPVIWKRRLMENSAATIIGDMARALGLCSRKNAQEKVRIESAERTGTRRC